MPKHRSKALAEQAFVLGLGLACSGGTAATERVIISASGAELRAFDAPHAASVVGADELRTGGPMINLSESLVRVPGLVANNRSNYAQDLQLGSRGFGARASFGVRGLRLVADGIPASGPDGQGQVSHFDIAGASRVEVLRGPFSALYGSSSGGVISLVSTAPTEGRLRMEVDAGSFGLMQGRLTVEGPLAALGPGWSLRASVSDMSIDGFRPQSAAERQLANVRLARDDGRDRIVLIANVLEQPAQDPLGLTRAQFEADPWQTATIALPQTAPGQADRFDTRKDTAQSQAGVSWRHRFAAGALAESQLAAWSGQRAVTQWQSIPVATQFNATTPTITERHPGGVIDFDRRYGGLDGRLVWRWALVGDRRLQLVAGAALESAREERRGFENFSGPAATRLLGVTGRLRRDESNRLDSRDAFFQADWDIAADWALAAGLRATRVRYASSDRYIVGGNGDDSGELSYSARSPVVSLQWRAADSLRAYLSLGRGFEAPTLGEVAYRPDSGTGFNNTLLPQTSRQAELGLKWRSTAGVALDLALFEARTADEIGVATNRGGRSTFRNVGRTTRRGAELALALPLGPQWRSSLALTVLDARYDSAFAVCAALPCLTPTLPVPAGNRIAGTQPKSLFAELVWQPLAPLELAAEVRGLGRVPVNDLNSDFAGGHGLLGLRARWTQVLPAGRLELQARIDNLANRAVAGSVIVSDANGRFFEPAPPRNALLSLRWAVAWP